MKRLLLVHNNALFREALALLLEWQTGLDSVEAGSVAEAHRILGEPNHEVCLAIVGIDLPNEDGIELIKELREVEPDCPVLALATARSLQRCTRALQAGAEEVLTTDELIEEGRGRCARGWRPAPTTQTFDFTYGARPATRPISVVGAEGGR